MRLLHDGTVQPPIFREATMEDIVAAIAAEFGLTPGVPLGDMAYQESTAVAITGGTITGLTGLSTVGRVIIQSGEFPGLLIGADSGATTLTDNTTKAMVIGLPHYDNEEESVCGLIATSGASSSSFIFGGGNGVLNAATQLSFYTAATTTTLTGTERMRIASDGTIGMGAVNNTSYRLNLAANSSAGAVAGFILSDSTPTTGKNFGIYSSAGSLLIRDVTGSAQRASISTSGDWAIGPSAAAAGHAFVVNTNLANAAARAIRALSVIQSTASVVNGFESSLSTAAAAFTVSDLTHFYANPSTFGAGSTVTNQFGFYVGSNHTGATNNYGFYGNMGAAANRWNLYMAGGAQSYINANLLLGTSTTSNGIGQLQVTNTTNQRTITVTGTAADSQAGIGFINDARSWSAAVRGDASDAFVIRDVTAAADRLTITSGGTVSVPTMTVGLSGAYQVGSTQVINARKTGWAVATGTATRTTFDTTTVTLPQLAERLKALIDDLHATAGHGLIGT
jgi:hypothetical protein